MKGLLAQQFLQSPPPFGCVKFFGFPPQYLHPSPFHIKWTFPKNCKCTSECTFHVGKTSKIAFREQWNFSTPCWSLFSWLIPATARSGDMQTGGFRLTTMDGLIVTRKINTWMVFGGMITGAQMMGSIGNCCDAPYGIKDVPATCKEANWWEVLDG